MTLDWIDPFSALGSAVLTAAAILAMFWRPMQRWFATSRAIHGENLPNGQHRPGLIDDVADLKTDTVAIKAALEHVVAELKPNHGSSVKDVVNNTNQTVSEVKRQVTAGAEQRERYHQEGITRDAQQNQRIDRVEGEIADLGRTTAVLVDRMKGEK